MSRGYFNDIRGLCRGLELVFRESFNYQKNTVERIWDNSSVRSLFEEQAKSCQQKVENVSKDDMTHMMKETFERASMVVHGAKVFATTSYSQPVAKNEVKEVEETRPPDTQTTAQSDIKNLPKGVSPEDLKVSELHHRDKELIEKLEREHEMRKEAELEKQRQREAELEKQKQREAELEKQRQREAELEKQKQREAELEKQRQREADLEKQKQREADLEKQMQREVKLEKQRPKEEEIFPGSGFPYVKDIEVQKPKSSDPVEEKMEDEQPTAKKYVPRKQELGPEAKQRRVPSSRIGRMFTFGSLAAGLGVGAMAEVARRTVGFSEQVGSNPPTLNELFLTEANAERIVNTLCRVRGAALKIGQILSIQDNTVINPVLQKAFERVRQSADFMPTWQVQKVLVKELGHDWRDKLSYFEEKPFAAASIGQVHHIRLKDGRECAMKIQYPGVAQGIESDINNLVGILKIWNVFPKGLFIDNLVEVAKRELAWEVDYNREAECTKKFFSLLAPYPDYVVPEVIDELSTGQIFTSTLIEGMPVDQCANLEVEHRERIAKLIMQLCLREVFEFRYMQTDPNWSNFFYDPNSRKLSLLDFGATRSYDVEFVKKYIEVIKAAADGDRERVLKISQDMHFLTGYESKTMENAHVDAVMILAEVFSSEEAFDFGHQDTTLRIQKLVPTIVAERLCPPPEEIYSLHRKLSGVFLLCAKFKVKISCREMFLQVYRKFKEETA